MMRHCRFTVLLAALWMPGAALPAEPSTIEMVRAWRIHNEQAIVDRFAELLSIPNVAADAANIRRNATQIAALLESAGLESSLLEVEGANPAVYAERRVPGAEITLLVYIHYDGQPVEPRHWASDPWQPVMRTALVEEGGEPVPITAPFDPQWRIFARSAGDDKAPIVALHSALLALDEAGRAPTVNLKVFLDGEEEAGSPNLRRILEAHRGRLASDLWLFCDGPMHQSRRWQLVYGVRGIYGFDLTVYGANRPLHSGHYGNWAPNPIARLVNLLGTMRDPHGTVLIDGFHDQVRPLTGAERAAIHASPVVDDYLAGDLGIASPETADRLELAIARPALNLRGIRSGGVGAQSRNAIQTSATASIGLRLVPDQTPEHVRAAVERHIERQGYFIVREKPTPAERRAHAHIARVNWSASGGYPAYRTDFDQPLAGKVAAILDRLSDGGLIRTPTMGGSLPIHVVDEVLATPVLILPIANHDNNQHGANENLRLQNLWDAIEIYAVVLTNL